MNKKFVSLIRYIGLLSVLFLLLAIASALLKGCANPPLPPATTTPVRPSPTTVDPYPAPSQTPTPGPYIGPEDEPAPMPPISFGIGLLDQQLYFPILPAERWRICRPADGERILARRGIAWMPGTDARQLDAWCASRYYNSQSNPALIGPGQHIIIWGGRAYDMNKAEQIAEAGYTGILQILNEPNLAEQADLPVDVAAQLTSQYMAMIPGGEAVIGNIFLRPANGQGYDYLDAYVAATAQLPIRALGVHFYFGLDGQDLTPFVDQACAIYERHRPEPCRLWVTEYGIHDQADPYQTFLDWTIQLHRHPAVEVYFGYTTSGAHSATPFLAPGGSLTPVGQAWIDSYWLLLEEGE